MSETDTPTEGLRAPDADPEVARRMAGAHADLARIVLGADPLGATATRVARIARDLVPGIDEVSVTLLEDGVPRTVAFTGNRASTLDERQYESGYGPCLDAAVTGRVIQIRDTAAEATYPDLARHAARTGIRHTVSVGLPTVVDGHTGAVNMYGTGDPLDQLSVDLATEFAAYVAVAVTNAAVHAGALTQAGQMREAMASRAVIEQAKGIIMAGRRCDEDQAFDVLRDASSRSNRKLRDIAQRLVDGIVD